MLADPMTKTIDKESRLDVVLRQGTYAIMREVHGLSQKLADRTINNQYKMNKKASETNQAFYIVD
jgi:hypothetical protein